MGATPRRRMFTASEYYMLERIASYKSDFYEGEIYDMSGGTPRHSLISANCARALGVRLEDGPCTVYEANLRLKIKANELRTYPDVGVYCTPFEYDLEDQDRMTVTNPTALVEVLSPSTQAYDRGLKLQSYRLINTLKLYLIVAQDRPFVEIHERNDAGTWDKREIAGLDGVAVLTCLQTELPLTAIYYRVAFDASVDSAGFP